MQFRDRDIIMDFSDRVYVVLGHIQPESSVICFLKYIPSQGGKWKQDGRSFQRVFWGSVKSVNSGYEQVPHKFIKYDDHFGTELLEIPVPEIKKHYRPEERLSSILDEGHNDELEYSVKETAEAINRILKIDFGSLGVAGSILWGAHDSSFSDINMNVYGLDNSTRLQNGLEDVASGNEEMRTRKDDEWERAISRVVARIPALSQTDLKQLFSRRKALYHQERCIGITPILRPEEYPISYASEKYETISTDPLCVTMQIRNAEYGMFHPAIYLGESESVKMTGDDSITRVMVYDGAFGGVIQEGDSVEVSGTLQRVHAKKAGRITGDKTSFYQLMVGTVDGAGKEFIRLLD